MAGILTPHAVSMVDRGSALVRDHWNRSVALKDLFRVAGSIAFEIFWRGSLPVELGLGLVSDLSRRTGESGVFVIV